MRKRNPRYRVEVVSSMGDDWAPPRSVTGTRQVGTDPAVDAWGLSVDFEEKQPELGGALGTAEHFSRDAPLLAQGEQFALWLGYQLFAEFKVIEVLP